MTQGKCKGEASGGQGRNLGGPHLLRSRGAYHPLSVSLQDAQKPRNQPTWRASEAKTPDLRCTNAPPPPFPTAHALQPPPLELGVLAEWVRDGMGHAASSQRAGQSLYCFSFSRRASSPHCSHPLPRLGR